MTFDAQCDLAAVVYGPDDDPDRLFIDFADDLSRSGRRTIGVIQVGRSCRSEQPRLGVVVLPGDEVVPLVDDLSSCTTGCRLNVGRLTGVAKRLAAAIAGGSDLVIINRFGHAEAAGGGLIDLITSALNAGIPVLIAVPEHRFPALIKFSAGMNVRLACRREALDRWWKSVTGAPANGGPPNGVRTFCEIGK
jgi:Protein of unknown function (DUF2478)